MDTVGLWAALWKRAAPRARLGGGLAVRPSATDAPMRAMMQWRPGWKGKAIAAILEQRPGCLIDVGTNVGQTLLDFLSAPVRSTYLGFEPNVTCYQHLAAFVSANRLDHCIVVPAGLGDCNGISTLYRIGGDVDSGASTMRALRPRSEVLSDACCIFRFDDISYLLSDPEIALIKIDVEGSELQVLHGMESTLRRTRPWIICEVLHRDALAEQEPYRVRSTELMQFVTGVGYSVHRIVQEVGGSRIDGLEPLGQFPDIVWNNDSARLCDYLFVPSGDSAEALNLLLT